MKNNYKKQAVTLTRWLFMALILLGFNAFNTLGQVTTYNYTGTIVTYTVPSGVTSISIDARGAEGGIQLESNAFGPGKGARMMSVFSVTPGQVLNILVGGQPASAVSDEGAGGGGGSFVTTSTNIPLLIAGGGGGEGADAAGVNANITTNGTTANIGGAGGTNGNGGFIQTTGTSMGSAGGGFFSDGLESCLGGRGRAFVNGAAGGISCGGSGGPGGFGCGGGGSSEGGGGGGGYSGGGGADSGTDGGGGGGSFNGGLQQLATAGFQSGNGQIIITELTTACVAPTAQPTALSLTVVASFQINGSFTGDPSADSYLIVRYAAGATPSQLPVDGVQYATGASLGNGTIVTSTTSTSFQATGLSLSTSYDFYVYSMNGICGGGPSYYTTAPLSGNATTPAGSSATALGGLWSSPATWTTGVVPPTAETVIIPAGSIVTVDQVVTAGNINLSGILQWNGTSNAMTITGNLTISPTGRFLPYTAVATPIGQTVNIGGNLTNNGYANCALGTGTQCLINFNGAGSVLGGSGVFEGDGTRGIIRQLFFQNLGSNSISTTQNITTYSLAITAGSLNTNGKLRVDNGANVYGLPVHTQVSSVAVTAMGSNYSVAPVVFGVAVTQWNNITGVLNTMYVSGSNVYRCVTAANIGPAAPTHTSGIAQNLLWIGTTGTLGTPFLGAQSHSVGTQYFYGDNLYVCTTAGAASTTSPPTHTSGIAASGAASFRYVGSPAKVSVNYDAATLTVRSLELVSGGSGYSSSTAPGLVFSVGVLSGTGSGASATSVIMYNNFGPANSLVQRSGVATITGGLTINSDQGASVASADPQSSSGVGSISTSNGGVNYTVAPQIAFGGPLALNLITNPGSGYTAAPTITVSGGTLVAGSAYTSSSFTITVNQGTVQSVYLTSTTAVYSVPPTLTMSAPTSGTTATLEFPVGCWPAATANIGPNGQLSSFTMTNAGYGYNTAPTVAFGPTSGTAQGGTFTTAATAPTSRIALYNLTLNYFSPAVSAVVSPDDVIIPSNRKLNNLSLAGNGNGLTLTGGDLTLFGTSPLTLTASLSSPGNILNLNGNNLLFTWNGYAGATNSTFNNAGANCYVKNGSITLTGRGGAGTFNFPFAGNTTTGSLTWFVGSTPTAITTGCNATKYTVTELGAPTNATYGSGAAMGSRSYRAQLNAGTVAGTNPTITLHFNSLDGLTTTQDQTFVAEASAQSGPWTIRSTAYGASATALPVAGSKASATTAPGPISSNGDNYYAFATTATAVTNFSPTNSCGGGTIVITGSGFTGATAVTFGGTPALSFTVNSSTQITAIVSNSGSTGLVSVTSPSGTGTSASTYTFDGVGPIVSIVEGSSIGICTGNSTTLTALPTGSGETYLWSPNAGGATTQQITVNTAGTYSCTITNTGGCFNVASATVFIDDVPSLTITSTPPSICSGQSATLSGTAIIGAPGVATVGTSTTTISGNDGNPYRSGNGTNNQIKVQLLYTAAELTAAGLTAGPITSLGFTTTASSTGTLSNFEIRIGSSSATALTTTFQTSPLTLVFTQASFTPLSSGVNTHVFNQGSFTWDGISNIIVQTCQTNNVSGTATVQAYTPAFLSNTSMQTSTTSCSSLTGTTPAAKPIITFGGIVGTNVASSLTWVWQPGNLSGSTQIVNPGSTTTYNVTATNSSGCSNTGSIQVQVSPTPVAPVISGGLTVCGQATTTLTSNAPGSGNAIEWFDVASGGTPIFTGTAFTTPILTASKTYYVQETGSNCVSARTPVTVTWNTPPTLAIYNNINNNTANVSFCGTTGIPVVGLSATAGSASSWAANGSTFSWSESHPGGLSCAGTCTASNSVDLNNILPTFNNENIILTANDPVLNCISSVAINVTAFTFPAFNAQATPPNVCTGGSTELSSGVSSANFAVSSIAYDAIPVPPTATVLCNGGVATTPLSTGNLDDGGWFNIPIGFNFNYFGNINTTFNVSTNGNIQFGASGSFSTSYTPGAIPTTAVPNNFVAMCWSDIYLTGSGTIRYFITGSTPNRICVIDWSNCVFYNSGNPGLGSVGGQILLYETTGVVEVHLTTATGLALGLSNGQKSLGLENAGGTIGAAAPGRNGTAWQTSVPEAWRFQPPVVYTFAWSSIPSGFTSSLATPTVFPTANTQYVVLVTDPITGCTKNDTILVEVNPIPSVAINPTSANVCSPGGTAAQLTASGDPADYSWSPSAGLDATTGAVVNALPTTSTNYVVTATTLAGCTATASAQVNVTQGPTVNVTATPPSACVGSDIQLEAVAITSGYSMNINCSTGFIDISATGTSIGAVGDDTEHYITIPAFTFNGVSYTEAAVGLNGVIVLGATSGDITLTNATLPTTSVAAGNVFLAPYWDDLDINLGATVVYQTVGNNFIIQWTNTDHNLFTTGGITFQVQMNLVTGVVTFVYPDAEFGSSTYDFGLTATIGIQMSGSNAVQYSSNTASLANGQCISFAPVTPNVTYDWSTNATYLSATNIANPIAQNVLTPETYTVIVTDLNTGCINTQNIPVSVNALPEITKSSNAPVCENQDINLVSSNDAPGQSTGNTFTWTGPGGFLSASQNPTISAATAANVGWYYISVQNSFGCTSIDSIEVTINENPDLNILSQTNVACNGALTGAYTIEVTNPISGGNYLYFDGSNLQFNDGTFTGLAAGSYNVEVTDDNSCTATIPVTITEPDPTTTADAGTDQITCFGNTATLSGNTALVGTGSWTVTAGGATVTDPSDPNSTVTGLTAGLNTFRWTIDNALCSNSNFDEVDIATNVLPTASISGTTEICNGNSTTLTIVFTGTAPYTYSYSNGVTTFGPFTTSNTTENITVAPNTTRTYTVTSVDDSNCPGTTSGSAVVSVSQAPPASSITVTSIAATGCVGDNAVVTTNTVPGATGYTWTVFPNTLINGQSGGTVTTTSPSATFTLGTLPPNESGWDICVTASNACGQTNTKCRSIRGALSTPAVISGTTVACQNSSGTYSTLAVAGAAGYSWSGTNGITFSGTGTSVTANFPSGFTSGQICVAATLSCGYSSAQRCITVTNSVSQLGLMSGPFAVCPGQSGLVFSVPSNAGLSSYNWVAPSGVTITSGQGTNSITVSVAPGFNIGNLCVTGTSNCGIVSASRCKTVGSTLPITPGNISGPSTGVCNATITYSVPAASGVTSYNWVAPAGATIVSGQGTNTVDISYPNGFSNGQLCVTAVNGCGSSAARCINIKGVPASPGVISGPITVCTGEQGLTYSIAAMFGASNYTWVVPAGSSIIAGQGTSSIIVDWGTTGGLVSVTATNSCGVSGTRTLNVIVNCKVSGNEIPGVLVNAYPNPVASELTIEVNAEAANTYSLELTDVSGRVVYNGQMNTTGGMKTTTVDVSALSKGIYMLTVRSNDGFTNQIRIAVQ